MKKKLLIFLFAFCLIIPISFIISGCDDEEYHEHVFSEWQIEQEADCTNKEIRYRVCDCGEKEKIESGEPLGHDFSPWATETANTCTNDEVLRRDCNTTTNIFCNLNHTWIIC